jgi:hypothetical protein
MLTIAKMAHPVTVALDACGGGVMLSLQDVDGARFRQALDASDAGAVLGVCNGYVDRDAVCEGDLVVYRSGDGLTFKWPSDGDFGLVHLSAEDMFVFEEALRSYCRLLMRSPEELP